MCLFRNLGRIALSLCARPDPNSGKSHDATRVWRVRGFVWSRRMGVGSASRELCNLHQCCLHRAGVRGFAAHVHVRTARSDGRDDHVCVGSVLHTMAFQLAVTARVPRRGVRLDRPGVHDVLHRLARGRLESSELPLSMWSRSPMFRATTWLRARSRWAADSKLRRSACG